MSIEPMNLHTATARNYSEESENRIHSDGAARTFGFDAALVPGASPSSAT